jgi:(2R)-sulfolactate sulfo-lyase subunit alpha
VHKFLVHRAGDDVGVATTAIGAGEQVVGVLLDDESTCELEALDAVPLGHKLAIRDLSPGDPVTEYGVRIGTAPRGFRQGEYVHTHNLVSARW